MFSARKIVASYLLLKLITLALLCIPTAAREIGTGGPRVTSVSALLPPRITREVLRK